MRPLAALLAVCALLLAGCRDPYAAPRPVRPQGPASPRAAAGDRSHSEPASAPSSSAPVALAPTARIAAARFALGWVNWDWRSAAARQRALARLAAGPLARELRQDARSTAADASLGRDRPGSRGTVVAIELHATGAAATGVVVTREQTYTAGHPDLGGRHYRVYLARLARGKRGWGVSRWAPQQ